VPKERKNISFDRAFGAKVLIAFREFVEGFGH